MKTDLQQKTITRLDAMDDEEWVSFMAYFAPKLIEEQAFLADVICRRAESMAKAFNDGIERQGREARHFPADHLAGLLQSCGLKLSLKE